MTAARQATMPALDVDQVRRHWEALSQPGEVREVRVLSHVPANGYGQAATLSGYFDSPDDLATALQEIGADSMDGVYITQNPVDPDLLARANNRLKRRPKQTTSDADITRLAHLTIDCDPVRKAGISSTAEELATALTLRDDITQFVTTELGWPEPLVEMLSGNGGQATWRIDLSTDTDGAALVHAALAAADTLFSTPSVTVDTTLGNPSRIVKLSGTLACKGDALPQRPHRRAHSVFHPHTGIVTEAQLQALAALTPTPEPRSQPRHAQGHHGRTALVYDVPALLAAVGIGYRERVQSYAVVYELDRCLSSDDHDDGAAILHFPSGAVAYKCQHNRCAHIGWDDVKDRLGLPPGLAPRAPGPQPPGSGSRQGGNRSSGHGATTDAERERPDNHGPYVATSHGIVYRRPTRDGSIDQLLSNFTAQIAEEVVADDGVNERGELVVSGELAGGMALPRIVVPLARFPAMDWPVRQWGSRVIVSAGMGTKDRLREAIQRLSPEPLRRRTYEHPGWRDLPDHGWCFLHGGGAIGTAGAISDVDMALHGAASRIHLPDPPGGDDLRAAVRACLSLRDLAPHRITDPLFGADWRAVLCDLVPTDTSVFLIGATGVFKTELAALVMQHVGAGFDRLHLPAQWSATPNFLERIAFDFKDAPLVIDDFAPGGTQSEIARLHATADRVLRGAGNRGGRGRMHVDGSLRPDYPPRGLVVGTGEDAPRGHSLRARVVILEVSPGDVDRERLTRAQAAGKAGTFAAAMAGYVQWLAPQIDALRAGLPSLLADLRTLAHRDGAHARTPEAVAHLALGWRLFLRFAAEVGVLIPAEAQATFDDVWAALGEAAARQTDYQTGEAPARRFLDLFTSALAAGHLHVASKEGRVPSSKPGAWGWRLERIGSGDFAHDEWRPQGSRAGWVDGHDLYLDLDAARAGVQRVSEATGNGIAVASKTLAKRLHEGGWLRSTEQDRGTLKVRRDLEGRRRYVLHLAASAITAPESAQSAQSAHEAPESAPSRGCETGNGQIVWAGFSLNGQESAQQIRPESAPPRAHGQIGQIGRIVGTPPGTDGSDDIAEYVV